MFESQSVASGTINSQGNEGGGCTEAFHCTYVHRCVGPAQSAAPNSQSLALIKFLFSFSPTHAVLVQALKRNFSKVWACFLPTEIFNPNSDTYNGHCNACGRDRGGGTPWGLSRAGCTQGPSSPAFAFSQPQGGHQALIVVIC